jgi:hypothetical protein
VTFSKGTSVTRPPLRRTRTPSMNAPTSNGRVGSRASKASGRMIASSPGGRMIRVASSIGRDDCRGRGTHTRTDWST